MWRLALPFTNTHPAGPMAGLLCGSTAHPRWPHLYLCPNSRPCLHPAPLAHPHLSPSPSPRYMVAQKTPPALGTSCHRTTTSSMTTATTTSTAANSPLSCAILRTRHQDRLGPAPVYYAHRAAFLASTTRTTKEDHVGGPLPAINLTLTLLTLPSSLPSPSLSPSPLPSPGGLLVPTSTGSGLGHSIPDIRLAKCGKHSLLCISGSAVHRRRLGRGLEARRLQCVEDLRPLPLNFRSRTLPRAPWRLSPNCHYPFGGDIPPNANLHILCDWRASEMQNARACDPNGQVVHVWKRRASEMQHTRS